MKIGLIQYGPVWEDKESNKAKILTMLESENEKFSALIFPEMTLTGFTMHSQKFAESIAYLPNERARHGRSDSFSPPAKELARLHEAFRRRQVRRTDRQDGESTRFFKELAKNFRTNIFAGIIEVEEKNFFNTLIHIGPEGELKSKYRKIHPFSYSNENKFYSRGKETVITQINKTKIGLSICYDLRFPELYRHYGKERVDLIINIANWPVTRIEHWRILLRARAIENQCYVVGVNRIGNDPKLIYNGFSSVFDPMGVEIITVENEERIIPAEINPETVREVRNKFPFLNDITLL